MANEKRLDLIDRKALLEKQYNSSPLKALQFVEMVVDVRDIEDAPTVDAVEVVHGRWEIKEYPITGCKKITCSICSYWVDRGPAWNKNWGFHHYCPNCGAKMDGGRGR